MEELLCAVCGWFVDSVASGEVVSDYSAHLAAGAEAVWEETEAQQPGILEQGLNALAGVGEVAKVANRVVERVAPSAPPKVKQKAALYLTQVPAQVRRSLRRPSDPTGRTIPPYLALKKPADLIAFLPTRLPRFTPGERPLPSVDLELVELLGVGGFGEVWKARNPLLASAEPVALKFCVDPQAARVLKHEAAVLDRVMANGRHPGIVQLRRTYLSANPPCLEYDLVEGGDLAGLIQDWHSRKGGMAADKAARIMLRLSEIIAFAHTQSPAIVHRDLKPANILIQAGTDKFRLRVADFGIGGIAATRSYELTKTRGASLQGTVAKGAYTPLYASPQQMLGKDADPRDDVYALGVIWYQMLMGDLNEGAPTGTQWLKRLEALGASAEQLDLLATCVEPRLEDRLASADVLHQRLKNLLVSKIRGSQGPHKSGVQPGREAKDTSNPDFDDLLEAIPVLEFHPVSPERPRKEHAVEVIPVLEFHPVPHERPRKDHATASWEKTAPPPLPEPPRPPAPRPPAPVMDRVPPPELPHREEATRKSLEESGTVADRPENSQQFQKLVWMGSLGILVFVLFALGAALLLRNYQENERASAAARQKKLQEEEELLLAEKERLKPRATIENAWIEHNIVMENMSGMTIHAQFTIHNLANAKCEVAAWVSYASGVGLRDSNGKYADRDGNVACHDYVIPRNTHSEWTSFTLFIPYQELHLPIGRHDLHVVIGVLDETGKQLCTSNPIRFTCTQFK